MERLFNQIEKEMKQLTRDELLEFSRILTKEADEFLSKDLSADVTKEDKQRVVNLKNQLTAMIGGAL